MNRTLSVRSAFAIVLISILLAFAVGSAINYLGATYLPDKDPHFFTYLSLFIGQGFMVLPVLLFLTTRKELLVDRLRLYTVSPATIGATIFLSIGIIILSDELDRLASMIFPRSDQLTEVAELLTPHSTGSAIFLVFSIVIFAPLGEELLFRGFLQKFLEESWKDITRAVLVTSLFFAVIHLNPYWVIQIYLLGVILGYLAWRTQSVLPSFILHGLNNGLALIMNNMSFSVERIYSWHGHVSPLWLLIAILFTILGFKKLDSAMEVPS